MPMSKPFRLRVLEALSAALAEITVANGFQHDLTGAVFRGRNLFGDGDPVPMLSILEEPIPPDPDMASVDGFISTGGWLLMLQGFAADDPENPTDPAHYLMADVKKRLAQLRKTRHDAAGGLLGFGMKAPMIDELKFGQGVVRPPDDISAKAYFWLTVELTLAEDHLNPFA